MQLGAARPFVVAAPCIPPVRALCTLLADFPSAGVHLSPFWGLGGYNSPNIDWNASVHSPVEARPWLSTSQVSLNSVEHQHRRKVELPLSLHLVLQKDVGICLAMDKASERGTGITSLEKRVWGRRLKSPGVALVWFSSFPSDSPTLPQR